MNVCLLDFIEMQYLFTSNILKLQSWIRILRLFFIVVMTSMIEIEKLFPMLHK